MAWRPCWQWRPLLFPVPFSFTPSGVGQPGVDAEGTCVRHAQNGQELTGADTWGQHSLPRLRAERFAADLYFGD